LEIKLPVPVRFILNKLNENGYEGYVVGGCVRDSIMGITPHDWDICTSALPKQIIEVFKDYKVIPTGIQHGTISVILDETTNEIFEITTYRIDGDYKDNRHPDTVEFVGNLKDDLSRRDFTINAMAYNEKDGLVDPFNGYDDIISKTIRCVGVAEDRFNEDALRIMRAIRFALRYNYNLELHTLEALLDNRFLLKNISAERICSELTKILSRPMLPFDPSKYEDSPYNRRLMELIKTLLQLIEVLEPEMMFDYETQFYRLYFANSGDYIFNLSIIFDGKYATDALKRLKFSNEVIKGVKEITEFGHLIYNRTFEWMFADSEIYPSDIQISRYYVRLLLHKIADVKYAIPAANFAKILAIKKHKNNIILLWNITYFKSIEKLKRAIEVCKESDVYNLRYLAINGNDLIELGFEGKAVGSTLEYLLNLVMADKAKNTKEDLKKFLRK